MLHLDPIFKTDFRNCLYNEMLWKLNLNMYFILLIQWATELMQMPPNPSVNMSVKMNIGICNSCVTFYQTATQVLLCNNGEVQWSNVTDTFNEVYHTCLRDRRVILLPWIIMSLSSMSILCWNCCRCRLSSEVPSRLTVRPSRSSLSITSCSFFLTEKNTYCDVLSYVHRRDNR